MGNNNTLKHTNSPLFLKNCRIEISSADTLIRSVLRGDNDRIDILYFKLHGVLMHFLCCMTVWEPTEEKTQKPQQRERERERVQGEEWYRRSMLAS